MTTDEFFLVKGCNGCKRLTPQTRCYVKHEGCGNSIFTVENTIFNDHTGVSVSSERQATWQRSRKSLSFPVCRKLRCISMYKGILCLRTGPVFMVKSLIRLVIEYRQDAQILELASDTWCCSVVVVIVTCKELWWGGMGEEGT